MLLGLCRLLSVSQESHSSEKFSYLFVLSPWFSLLSSAQSCPESPSRLHLLQRFGPPGYRVSQSWLVQIMLIPWLDRGVAYSLIMTVLTDFYSILKSEGCRATLITRLAFDEIHATSIRDMCGPMCRFLRRESKSRVDDCLPKSQGAGMSRFKFYCI
jgi:hypothetical protein